MGYTKIHALKTAHHEAVSPNGIPLQNQNCSSQILHTNTQQINCNKSQNQTNFAPLKKVYRSEVSFFLAVHLDVCNMPIILMNVLILALSIFRFILIVLHLLVFKLSFHFLLSLQQNLQQKQQPWFPKLLHQCTQICLLYNGFFLLPLYGRFTIRIFYTINKYSFCFYGLIRSKLKLQEPYKLSE